MVYIVGAVGTTLFPSFLLHNMTDIHYSSINLHM